MANDVDDESHESLGGVWNCFIGFVYVFEIWLESGFDKRENILLMRA